MTTALGSTDLANLRGTGAHTYRGYLAIVPQTSFATARVNQTTFTRPLAQITVDNTSAEWLNVLPGMTCWIGTTAGTYNVGVFRVRATPGASTLYLQELSTGDFGRIPNITTRLISDNDYITIISDFSLWSVFPRIAYSGGADGTFYKDYNVAYTDQNETGGAVPGVVNIGTHQQGTISGSDVSLSFTCTAHAFDGTISSYAWNFGDGTPSTATGVGPHSVDFPEGNRWIRCTVTFSGGATVTAYRHVWAWGDTNTSYTITSAQSRKTKQGRRMTARIVGSAYHANPIRQGAMVMYYETTLYDNSDSIASAASQFTGWVSKVTFIGQADGLNEYEVEIVGALELSRQMVLHAQQLTVAANPAHWQQVSAGLSHIDFFTFYLLHYHTTLTKLFDFHRSTLTGYTFPAWKSDRGNATDEINRVLGRLNLSMTQDSDGSMRLVRDPSMLETSTLRNALVTRISLTEGDVKAIRFTRNLWPLVGQVQANGFSVGTDSAATVVYKSYAPGQTGGQGAGIEVLDNQLLGGGSLTAEAELNARSANLYAKANRPYEGVSLDMARGNYENIIEPSQPVVIELAVSATYSPTGEAVSLLLDPSEVSITYRDNGTKDTSISAEVITTGYVAPGQAIPITVGNDRPLDDIQFPPIDIDTGLIDIPYDPFGYNPPLTGSTVDPFTSVDNQAVGYLVAGGDDGTGITRTPVNPAFTLVHAPAGETTVDGMFDPRSPKLTSDKTNGALRLWLLTNAALYYCANILATSPTITEQQSLDSYTILRAVRGVAGGVAAYGHYTFSISETLFDTLNVDSTSASYVYTSASTHVDGSYRVTVSGTYVWDTVFKPTQLADGYYYQGPGVTTSWVTKSDSLNMADGYTPSPYPTFDAGHNYEWTRAGSGSTFGFRCNDSNRADNSGSMTVTIYETLPEDCVAIAYSDDSGATIGYTQVGAGLLTGPGGFDCDDYNLGVMVAVGLTATGTRLYCTQAYDDASADAITGVATTSGGVEYNLVRIPYRLLTSTAANNDHDALAVVWGADGLVSGATLWRGVLDRDTSTMSSVTDITPTISGTTYRPAGPNALETNANDSRIMLMLGIPTGGGDTRLLYRNAAGTWSVVQNPADYVYTRWVNGNAAYFAGDDGIGFSPDRGVTLEDRTGDFVEVVSALPVNFVLGGVK